MIYLKKERKWQNSIHSMKQGVKLSMKTLIFSVAFGWDKQNECYSVGMRWSSSANPYPLSPSGSGQPQWFILHWDLAVEFLKSLKAQNSANQKAIDEAIDKLQK